MPAGSAPNPHALPVTCALTCFWLLLLFHTAFGQKPAKLPLVGRKPFIAAWNAPLDMCTTKERLRHLLHPPTHQLCRGPPGLTAQGSLMTRGQQLWVELCAPKSTCLNPNTDTPECNVFKDGIKLK